MTPITHQFIDRSGAVTEIEVKCAGELAHEGRAARRLWHLPISDTGKPRTGLLLRNGGRLGRDGGRGAWGRNPITRRGPLVHDGTQKRLSC